jgi:type II secretory pathway pseudopilin PulG
VRGLAVVIVVFALSAAVPAQAAAPTMSRRVQALETQVRVLTARVSEYAAVQAQWQQALDRSNCNLATLYATVGRIYQSFGDQIAGLGGKVLTPATLPPYDDGGACARVH